MKILQHKQAFWPASCFLGLFLTSSSSFANVPASATQSFSVWKKDFAELAQEKGIKKETLKTALDPVELDPSVQKLIAHQPEFTKSVWEYLDAAVSKSRVRQGRRLLAKHEKLLKKIEKQFGVQPQYLVAIWGLETSYGKNFGGHSVIRSLATLAYDSDRSEFYSKELLAALRIIEEGHVSNDRMIGSWAGAMGHTQFMPSTFMGYAINFDNNPKKDLWNSLEDVFASTANYLEKANWQAGQPWGIEVKLPKKVDWTLADPTTWLTLKEWSEQGVLHVDGRSLNHLDEKEARLFLPAGHNGPAFLVFKNFLAFKVYNNSDSYALAVGYLGDRIRGAREIQAKWPRKDVPLSFTQKEDLQYLLTVLGYDTGGVDGKIGPNTREALRNWQTEMGLPADGYVNEEILNLLR